MKRQTAEQIVAAIKDCDRAWGQLDIALSEIDDEQERNGMRRVLLGMHTAAYSHITLPITRQFPELYPYPDQPSWFFEKFEPRLSIRRVDPGPLRSALTIHDERVYLSGVMAEDTSRDISDQTKQVLAELQALLEKVGSGRTKIVSALIFLADMDDAAAMNAVWDDWIVASESPARTMVQATLSDPAAKIEITVVAAL